VAFINVGVGELWVMRADGRQRRPLVQRFEVCCSSPAWSPDSKRVAFVRAGDYGRSGGLWVIDTKSRRLRRLTTREDESPAWRPDGRRIAFVRGGDIQTIPSKGGNASNLTRTRRISEEDPSWSPDGRFVFSAHRGDERPDLFVMNANGSGLGNVTATPESGEYQPDWSPDGKELLFCDGERDRRLFILNADRSNLRQFETDSEFCGEPDWSPDGERILFHRGPFSQILSLRLPNGEITPVVEGRSDSSAAWSPDGRRLAFSRDGWIHILRLRDGKLARVISGDSPSWSPDGRRLAVDVPGDPGGIFIVRADGAGNAQRIILDGAEEDTAYGDPAWSPDGSRLAFHSVYWRTTPSVESVCVLRIRSPRRWRCLAEGAAPRWSPDGRVLVYECGHYKGPHGICTIQSDGKGKRMISTRGRRPSFSPDGRRFVYYVSAGKDDSYGPGARSDVYVMKTDGSDRRRLTRSRGHDFDPDWQASRR
jgi:TolB protein